MKSVGLQHHAPNLESSSFEDWWEGVDVVSVDLAYNGLHKGLNSLIILGAWAIWNHRNSCVFNGVQPSQSMVINWVKEEAHLWYRAGARDLSNILMLQ